MKRTVEGIAVAAAAVEAFLPVSGVEEARKAVRENAYVGADFIKVVADSGRLVLGAAETTINLDSSYSRLTHGAATFYQV